MACTVQHKMIATHIEKDRLKQKGHLWHTLNAVPGRHGLVLMRLIFWQCMACRLYVLCSVNDSKGTDCPLALMGHASKHEHVSMG